MTVGEAFEAFFANPKWDSYKVGGQEYVDFTGKCSYLGESAAMRITFIVSNETFQVSNIAVNGDDLPELLWPMLLSTIYSGAEDGSSESGSPEIPECEPSGTLGQDNTSPPIQEDNGLFKDFIGSWEGGEGAISVLVYYSGETQQQAYAEVSTPAGLFTAELTLTGDEEANGSVVYDSEPAYTVNLKKHSDYLDATIYYPDHDYTYHEKLVPVGQESPTDSFNFVPVDSSEGSVEDVPRDSNGIPYSEYNLQICEGSYSDYNGSIILTITLLPNETEFSCDLFWIHGKFLEQGTVSPGVPAQLSGGTTITLDLYQCISAHVLLEGDDLGNGPHSMDLMKTT